MSDNKRAAAASYHPAMDGRQRDDRRPTFSLSSTGHGSAYLSKKFSACKSPYHPIHYPRSYTHQHYPFAPYHKQQTNPDRYNNADFFRSSSMAMTHPTCQNQSWNRFNLPSPLTSATTKNKSIAKPQTKDPNEIRSVKSTPPSNPQPSKSESSNEYIDPKILEAAKALGLPPGGRKYSVAHWKSALRLCYQWKTTTNEDERHFFRTSTTTNSLSSSTLKSIKFFCENILKRQSKRRQFAIHWKDSGLKKLVEEASSSDDALFAHDDPKLESIIDDYFSGRTRSNGYNQAKERVLDDRQKDILYLWDELMSGPVLSDASSHQKLYLIQLAIERPYRNKKVEIERMDRTIIHDVAIEGYGGKPYWEGNKTSLKEHDDEQDASLDKASKSFDGVLPNNEAMVKRFWKFADSFSTPPKRQEKRRKMENAMATKLSPQLSQNTGALATKNLNAREYAPISDEDKENNERSSIVAI